MSPEMVAEIQRKHPSIPWEMPIRVQFDCDSKPLFGCRLCILRFGLRTGDRHRLFSDEGDAGTHSALHAGMPIAERAAAA